LYNNFDTIRRHSSTLFINKDFRNAELEQALTAGEKKLRERHELTPVRSSDFSRVYRFTTRFGNTERCIYFKQYLCRSALDFIKHLIRSSRARRAFTATLMLEKNGFEAPVVAAMGEYKFSFLERENFLLTIEVEGAIQINQIVPESLEKLSEEELQIDSALRFFYTMETQDKRGLIRALGQTIGKMHEAGIFHGDLRLGNVLLRRETSGWHFFFIDNERTRKFRKLPSRLRLKNLVQANMLRTRALSSTDRMRFFKSYLGSNPQVRKDWKNWSRKTILKTEARLRKKVLATQNITTKLHM